jgi:trk system potassium uptake protein TrkH
MIKNIMSWLLCFLSVFFLLPLICAAIYGEEAFFAFLISIGISLLAAALLRIGKPKNTTLYAREGFVIASLGWIVISIFGALPFVLSGAIPNFLDAVFETVSGFTTTGSSILLSVEALPKSVLLWRSFTNWVGGMGVLVLMMVFLPLCGATNMHIMKAESPGPTVGKMVPRVSQTAKILYAIYLALTVTMLIFLLFGGMSFFDALNTALATAGTGGFGVKNDSMASYSPYIQVVVTVFMLLFSINFNSYYLILCKKIKDAFNLEVKTFVIIVLSSIAIITANISSMFASVGEALRHSAFSVATVISTSGFATVDFDLWPSLSKTLLVLLMFVGACAGSTGGGIKVSRILIFIKGLGAELRRMLHPREVKKSKMDGRPIDGATTHSVNTYMICYLLVFISSVVLISLDGKDLITNFTAVVATINNIGPGLSLVGPTCNFAHFSPLSKIVLIFDMLAGRLELFPLLLLFSPATYKK